MLLLFVSIFILPAPAGAGIIVPPPAEPSILNDSEEPGSVLIFHKFIRGTVPPTGDLPATEIAISVTCPDGSTCAGEPVFLRAHWVCPGKTDGVCHETKFDLDTTVKGTIRIRPDGHPQGQNPPCDEGYLIVWVIDDHGNPIKFDGLIGHAVIRHAASRDFPTVISEGAYNALPIQAAAHLHTGDFTDGNGNKDGKLDFDGTEYKAITGTIFGTVRYEESNSSRIETHLTLLTLDVKSNQPNDPTHVEFNFFNENEHVRPSHLDFTCWTQVRLTDIDSGLNTSFGTKGLVESTSATQVTHPVTLVGIVSTLTFSNIPIAPGVCEQTAAACTQTAATCTQTAATCTQTAATCAAGCTLANATCTGSCTVDVAAVCAATVCSNVCPGSGFFGILACTLCQFNCATAQAGLANACTAGCALTQATCQGTCAVTQGTCTGINGICTGINGICTATNGACQVVGATTSVPAVSEYSYSLFNDSKAVATTYDPFLDF
jgi:hypothetical protein